MQGIIIQLLGFIGFILLIIQFQINDRFKMLLLKTIASFFFAMHFFLLGAMTGSIMNLLAGFRSIIFQYRTTEKWADNKLWLYFFIILFLIFGIITWDGYYTILPMIGVSIGTFAYWMKNPKHIRLVTIFSPPLWFIHNFIVKSYAGMLTDSLVFCSIAIAIYRYDITLSAKKKIFNKISFSLK